MVFSATLITQVGLLQNLLIAALPSPLPAQVIVRSAETPAWTYGVQYLIQAGAAAATIYAAYVAVGGAYRAATRQAEATLRTQRQANHADRVRVRDELSRTTRAVRRQVVTYLWEAFMVVRLEGAQPAVGTIEENARFAVILSRFVTRAYDLDVAASFDDDEIDQLHRTADYVWMFSDRLAASWKAPYPRDDELRKSISGTAINTLGFFERALAAFGEHARSQRVHESINELQALAATAETEPPADVEIT